MKKLLAVGIIVLFIGAIVVPSTGMVEISNNGRAILYVGGSGPGNYTSIQDAIDDASGGDTVFVYNGTYTEQIIVNKSIVLEGESNSNTIVVGGFNFSENNATIRYFNITGGYEWYVDGTGINGTCRTGIYSSSSNNIFYNNHIWNITGDNGGTYASGDGGRGGSGEGIYLFSSNNNNIILNNISKINAGDGGNGEFVAGNGSIGGTGTGVYLYSSKGNNITLNNIFYIDAGDGGRGYHEGNGGNGGNGTGIQLCFSDDNNVTRNNISHIISGIGGIGGDLLLTLQFGSGGGVGGVGSGIHLQSSNNTKIVLNNISNIQAGNGGQGINYPGGDGGNASGIYLQSSDHNIIFLNNLSKIAGGAGGKGSGPMGGGIPGDGGAGVGFYLQTSYSNAVTLNNASNIVGGNGGNGGSGWGYGVGGVGVGIYLGSSNLNNISTNSFVNITGGSGGMGYGSGSDPYGFDGGNASGIYLQSSDHNIIFLNNLSKIAGGAGGYGDGGTGGTGAGVYLISSNSSNIFSNGISFISGGDGDFVGDGGDGTGIFLYSSTENNITLNTIYNNTGGIAGVEYGVNGTGTGVYCRSSSINTVANCIVMYNEYGFLLSSSFNNLIYYNNLIENGINAFDTGTNTWYNVTLQEGNYWSDFDEPSEGAWDNDSDGIVDSPYNIAGGDNQDRYPFIEPSGWINSAPNIPNRPSGEILGEPGIDYTYTTSTDDSDNDLVWYKWDWGDGSYSEWLGPYESGEEASATQSWSKGIYQIRVKAKDNRNPETEWSESLTVKIIYPNFKTVFLFGSIANLSASSEYYIFNAVKLLWINFNPIFPQILTSNETIVISNKYFGILRPSFIFGFFNAMILT